MQVSNQPDATAVPWVVLDTNVALDALLFQDCHSLRLLAALRAKQLRWVRMPAMLDELADVLRRPFAQGLARSAQTVFDQAQALSVEAGALPPLRSPLRCSDRDDQIFIDLALALPARWLFTRDRALLALAKPAALRGVAVLTPAAWPGLDSIA